MLYSYRENFKALCMRVPEQVDRMFCFVGCVQTLDVFVITTDKKKVLKNNLLKKNTQKNLSFDFLTILTS